MTRETLERLLADRALGALDGDVSALLDAHLAADPEAAALAARTAATVALARQALAAGQAVRPPDFPRAALARRMVRLRRWRVVRGVLGAAAVLVLGVLAGRWTLAERAVAPLPRVVGPAVVRSAEPPAATAQGTSVLRKSILEWQRRADRIAAPRWNWTSPAKLPRVGGAS